MPVDINFLVGGEAGQGIQTIGFVLGKTMARGGLHVFADQDYESRIRGGHNFFRVRVKDEEVKSQTEKLDILIALNKETIDRHMGELKENGVIILDRQALKLSPAPGVEKGSREDTVSGRERDYPEAIFVDVPLEKLAVEAAVQQDNEQLGSGRSGTGIIRI